MLRMTFARRSGHVTRIAVAVLLAAGAGSTPAASCSGSVYLTFDTGNMRHAEAISEILRRHEVKATFFLASERTSRGDFSLDDTWGSFWKSLAGEGHAFGSHTWRHGRFSGDVGSKGVRYRPAFGDDAGRTVVLSAAQVCEELKRVDTVFRRLTGRGLDSLWRAPGGVTTPGALDAARACGYTHVHWAPAGFLGDELPSDRFSNEALLARALRDVRDGDVLMAHLGIWSRQDPFAPMIDPLIAGLKQRGMCFRTLREHPQFVGSGTVPQHLAAAQVKAHRGAAR